MIIHDLPLGSNPFFDSFFHTDPLGKVIFIGLIACSIVSWVIIFHKIRLASKVRALSTDFYKTFQQQRLQPLNISYNNIPHREFPHPFFQLYQVLRKNTVELLNKNRSFASGLSATNQGTPTYLSPEDVSVIESQLASSISSQTMYLEKNLYILSTIVSLAPFLGLLGTVWGILTTFTELQAASTANTNQMMLGGLSLALATTVIGLLDAIPALVGYNYLRNNFRDYQTEMEGFANEILATVELHYRKVD